MFGELAECLLVCMGLKDWKLPIQLAKHFSHIFLDTQGVLFVSFFNPYSG